MDPFELLKDDHRKVEELFRTFESMHAHDEEQKNLAEKVFSELEVHMAIKEEIFYPAVKMHTNEHGGDLVNAARKEHQNIKDLIEELRAMDINDKEFEIIFKELIRTMEHHIEEEEHEMFPLALESIPNADEVGLRMDRRKKELTSGQQQEMEPKIQPHPGM